MICEYIRRDHVRHIHIMKASVQWRHNERDGVSNHQRLACLLNRLFTGFVRGIHRRPMDSPHKWPVTRKMISFDDVIVMF